MDEYYEDVTVGARYDLGSYEVTTAEIREFAARYDPQPAHTGEDAPAVPFADGVVASGWHTAAMTMRVLVEGYLRGSGALVSTGVDRLRWPEPVRPGDRLRVEAEVLEKTPREEHGEIRLEVETRTDRGVVLSMVGKLLFRRRSTAGDSDDP